MQKFTWEYPSGDAPEAPEAPCPRLGKWIGGCRFEARYSFPTFDVPPGALKWGTGEIIPEAVKAARPLIYEGDVCVRCGKRASRDTPSPQNKAEASQAKPQQNTVED